MIKLIAETRIRYKEATYEPGNSFLCDDIDEVATVLTGQGYPSLQSGHFGDPKTKAGGFNYFDIKPLHVIWEPVHKPRSLPIEPFARVP